jgi:type I restriction enzyme S subunit
MSSAGANSAIHAWVGKPPADWRSDWLKWSVSLSTERPTNEEIERLPYIANEDITSWTGKLLNPNPQPVEADSRRFRRDDVLFNKLRPYLAKVYHTEFGGLSSGELLCLRPSPSVLSRFLFYVVSSKAFVDAVNAETFGSKMPRADWDIVGHQPLPLPPLDTQKRIAAFLDEKMAQIDALIEKKQALLERLAEKRQAIITQAVTKGLNPLAPMKPSGIDWLGNIPAHWEVKRLKFLGETILGLTYSPGDVVNEGEGVLVLRSSNIQNGQLVRDDNVFVQSEIPAALVVRAGDILICSRNGSRALIGKNALITPDFAGQTFGAFMTVFRTTISDFVHLVLNSNIFSFQSGRYMTSTINQLTVNAIKDFAIPLPPTDERTAIVLQVRGALSELDKIAAKALASVQKLQEYRSALITAAVTGQIERLR